MWMDKLSIIESILDRLKVVGQGLIFVGLHREFELIFSLLDYQSLQVGWECSQERRICEFVRWKTDIHEQMQNLL